MSALATTVVMATLAVGPLCLSTALALDAAQVGLVMSCGPLAAALAMASASLVHVQRALTAGHARRSGAE